MIITHDINEVVLTNVNETSEFKIRNSSKAFRILSNSLYSNKIRAIIRELSCNALDSHVAAGKINVPFEVHLPSMLEPWFSVKDFGVGLGSDQVINIYTTYFESTKTNSNEFIGALGLGSKSPFSYTENFTITAIKDGIQCIYSAFINEMGVPSIVEMARIPTINDNGVEVKFSVTNRCDFYSFKNEAQEVFSWFKHHPTIIGSLDYQPIQFNYKEKDIIPGVHIKADNGYDSHCMAVMGNIAYPLSKMPEPLKHLGNLIELLNCGLVMEFNIGELDFAASREELSYVPSTLKNIKKKLEQVNENLVDHLTKKANAISCEWARAEYLVQESRSKIFRAAVIKYLADTKFELYDPTAYYGQKTFYFPASDLMKRNLSIQMFRVTGGTVNKIGESSHTINNTYVSCMTISVSKDIIIVLNDLKTGCLSRARYHYANHNNNKGCTVVCISHSDTDLAIRDLEYLKIIQELHNPPIVVKASSLEKQVREKSLTTQGIMTLQLKSGCSGGHYNNYMWAPYNEKIDDNIIYNFVYLNNHTAIYEDGTLFDMYGLKSLMDQSGINDISKIQVFGVRKSRAKEINEYDNWVWIEEILKTEIAKVSDEHIISLMAHELLDTYYEKVYTSQTVAKFVGVDSYYAKFVREIAGIKRVTGNVVQLATLCDKYGKTVKIEEIKTRIREAKDLLYRKYPLLQLLRYDSLTVTVTEKDIANYIIMIDKQDNIVK